MKKKTLVLVVVVGAIVAFVAFVKVMPHQYEFIDSNGNPVVDTGNITLAKWLATIFSGE
jgi:hypothetical protein